MARSACLLALLALLACGDAPNPLAAQVDCLTRCGEDYQADIEKCFDPFWDSDKRVCVERVNDEYQRCRTRCN